MLNTTPAEFLLARLTSTARAAAILGDLLELSATRGRLWFWTAYARTLLSLTWRIPVALFAAVVCRELIFDLFHLYLRHTPAAWRTTSSLDLLNSSGPLLACIMSTLWFVLPYAVVLYGVRDRFVQLALPITLGATITFLFMPLASPAFALATLAVAAGALLSRSWRKPLEALAGTAAAGILAIAATSALARHFRPQGGLERTLAQNALVLSLLVLAMVCSRLHRLFLQPPPNGQSTPA